MKGKFLTAMFLLINLLGFSQQNDSTKIYKFKLDDAINFALENNLTITNSELDIRKAKWKVWETTAIGLPQVNTSGQFQYYTNIPTQLFPDFITMAVYGVNMYDFGLHPVVPPDTTNKKMAVQFGSPINISGGITISQLLFNGEWLVGLQAAKTYKLISEQGYDKAKIELKAGVRQAYFMVLLADESLQILLNNYKNINSIYQSTQKSADIGMIDQTQADQIEILQLNLENQINTIIRQKSLAGYMLKFQLGLNPQDSLELLSSIDDFKSTLTLDGVSDDFNMQNNIDYQMMNTQIKLKELSLKQSESKFLPTLSAYFSYSQTGMLDDFSALKNKESWHPSSLVGVKLDFPIFSSGQRYAVVQQQKIDLTETQNKQTLLNQQLNIQFLQAKDNYLNAYETLLSQEKNKKLSEKIFNNTQIKFSQGSSSNVDLTQAQNQFLQSQANYYQALMQLLNAKISLDKILNN